MIELNIAQVIGYSVQVLLILALLVALSVKSWPFLIAIVFMGLLALALACMRAANNVSKQVSTQQDEYHPELTSGHRVLNDTHDDIPVPGPPLDIDSLDHVRQVSLALEGKAPISEHRSMPQSAKLDRRQAPLMAAVHAAKEARSPYSYHQSAGFAGSDLYAQYLATTRVTQPEQAAHYPGAEAGRAYSPEKHGLFHAPQTNEYARPPTGYVRQYTSPLTQTALGTTPHDLESRHREERWLRQTAQPMHGLPYASSQLLNQFGVNDWQKPDPNLVPVNPRSRSYVPKVLRPKTSPWATKSYLYRK
jgi:hypothetical protein